MTKLFFVLMTPWLGGLSLLDANNNLEATGNYERYDDTQMADFAAPLDPWADVVVAATQAELTDAQSGWTITTVAGKSGQVVTGLTAHNGFVYRDLQTRYANPQTLSTNDAIRSVTGWLAINSAAADAGAATTAWI